MTSPDPYAALRPPAPPAEQDAGERPAPPQYTSAQAAQAVQQVQEPGKGADAGASLAQVTDRGPVLPAESVMDDLMAKFKAMSEQMAAMQAKLDKTSADAAAVRAITGPPAVNLYAQGVADKIESHRNANPDVPAGHFDQAMQDASDLAAAGKALADGDTSAGGADVPGLGRRLERFLTRTHQVRSGKHLDFSAVLADLELALEEAEKLAGKAA